MIYPQSNVAAMIAARLTKSKGYEYGVTKVATGFEVAPKTGKFCALKPNLQQVAKEFPQWTAAVTAKPLGPNTSVKLRFRGESAHYVDAWVDGKPVSFGKNNLVSWKVEVAEGESLKWVAITMPTAFAKKRGLI